MENQTLLQLLFQVMLFLGSFTTIVFGYVFLTSAHGSSRVKKAVATPETFWL